MNLSGFCIRRPAFTIVISLVMTIIGIIGFANLPVRWIPNINPPQISIWTSYNGANARSIERDVTKVIEESLAGINGIEMLTSSSHQNYSQVSIIFKLGHNMDVAVEEVRSSIERIRNTLPKDAKNPIVMKANPNNIPILFLTFYHPSYSARQLSDYIDKYVMPSFETIDGVGSVQMYGRKVTAMRVWLDPVKMAGANITADEIMQILQEQNTSIPSGQIRGHDKLYNVFIDTSLKTPKQFSNLIIRNYHNKIIRLKDIAEVKLDPENDDSAFRVNGKPAVALGIAAQSTSNPLEVEKRVQKELSQIKRSLPHDMQVSVVFNQADYIHDSINSVYEAFIEAIIFVWLIIFAFLCSFRATLIPIITIPVCVVSTFALLYFLGFSINTITLMAFVLAIGLVVDDAIVMLENINRYIEQGLSPFQSAIKGSREIIFPIIAMTLTLSAVYIPIAFTSGLMGVIFREFTFTLAGAVIISGIVALTLSPMMCARLLTHSKTSQYHHWLLKNLSRLQNGYKRLLLFLLGKRNWVMVLLIVIGGLGLGIFKLLPSELAPPEDMGEINAYISAPRNASFQYTDAYVNKIEALFKDVPDIESYVTQTGTYSSSHAWQLLKLKPKWKRMHSLNDVVSSLTSKVNQIPGVRVNVFVPPSALSQFAGGDEGDNLSLVLMTSNDYLKLQDVTAQMMEAIKQYPGFVHVDNKLKWNSEQFQIQVNRDKAADLKVSIPTIAESISSLLTGREVGKTEDTKIIIQMAKTALADPNFFKQLYARNSDGKMVALSNMITMNEISTPETFHHYDRMRSDTINLTLAPSFKLSDAIEKLQSIAKQILPDDIKYTFTGEAKDFIESNGKTMMTFGLAIIFIYLVLVAQFESFIDPMIIMLTVPFAVVGAMATLKIFGGSMNIYSNIGMITLIGLIAKHGILITEFANKLRLSGKSIQDAIIEASLLRLRPILMTTAAMVLGALPLAFAFSPGAESRQQIGLVITGGMLLGTFFSLIVVPITYTYLAPFRKLSSSQDRGE